MTSFLFMWNVHGRAEISFYIQARRLHELRQKQSEGPKRRRGKAALKASLDEAMEAKRKAEDEAAALREKLIAMEESQKKLQEATAIKKSAGNLRNKTSRTRRN